MIRSAVLVALACALCGQCRPRADVARRSRDAHRPPGGAIRDLTGTVEQLQYRNQQLEQQLQRLQGDAGRRRPTSRPAASPPPLQRPAAPLFAAGQYSPPPPAPYHRRRRRPAVAPHRRCAGRAAPPAAPRRRVRSGAQSERARRAAAARHQHRRRPSRRRRLPEAPWPGTASAGRAARSLDLSAPPGGPAPGGDLPPPPPPNPNATGAMQATLPPSQLRRRTNTISATAIVLHKDYALGERTVPRLPAQISERPAGAGSAILARREPVPAPAISRRRRGVPHRLDQIRDHRAGAGRAVAARPSRSRRSAKRKRPAPRSAKCCANIRAPRSA